METRKQHLLRTFTSAEQLVHIRLYVPLFITTVVSLLRCTNAFMYINSQLYIVHYVISLYIGLFAAGVAGLSEPCDVLHPNVGLCFPCACSSMSAPEL